MTRQTIFFQIDTQGETFNFVERTLGQRGRDILAIKMALGQVQTSTQIENASPQDFSIGSNWFDCETGTEVSSIVGATFDEKMKSKLMNYQINNQLTILMFYFEKYLSMPSLTKEDLLAQIFQVESIFESELGNVGEGTLACLMGYAPGCDLTNEGYYSTIKPMVQLPMYIYESIKNGSMALPDSVEATTSFQEDEEEHSNFVSNFSRFYNSKYDLANRLDQQVGIAIYNIPPSESALYSAASSIAPLLPKEADYTNDVMSRVQVAALSSQALEPDYLTDPDPFLIDMKTIGMFTRTEYTLENLPPIITGEIQASLISSATAQALVYYKKTIDGVDDNFILGGTDSGPLVKFIELRTPSLRPSDVYRAYFTINKEMLQSLPASADMTGEETIPILESKIAQNIENLEADYCADGADPEDSDAKIQYQKYRAYASKRKKEIIRELRGAIQTSQDSGLQPGSITADLGPFGQIDVTDTQLMASVTNNIAAAIGNDSPKQQSRRYGPNQVRKSYQLWEKQLKRVVENFQNARPDLEKYKLSDKSFSADEEASRIAEIMGSLDSILSHESQAGIKQLKNKTKKSLSTILTDITWKGTPGAQIQINFENDTARGGSKIQTIILSTDMPGFTDIIIYDTSKSSLLSRALKNPRTVHYLRNIDDLHDTFQGICVEDAGSVAGLGATYILKHTLAVQAIEQEDYYNPIHNFLEPASQEVKKLSKQINNYDENRPNPLNDFFGRTTAGEVLPLIGPKCNWELIQDEFIQMFRWDTLLCRYLKCLGLPAVNIKLPNFKLPDIPKLPTFKFPGMEMDILDLMKEILQRLACRFVKNILDILKTPFCSDNFIEDLYGAGSNVATPSMRKALADGLVDLGIPSDLYDSAGNMLDDVGNLLTPRELCALLQGNPLPQAAMKSILRAASLHGLQSTISNDDEIYSFFSSLTAFLDPSFCEDLDTISQNLARYGCNTITTPLQMIRNRILRNENVKDSEIQQALAISEQNFKSKLDAFRALGDGEGIKSIMPEVIYQPGNPNALVNGFPEPVLETAVETADLIFEAPEMSYASALKNYTPALWLNIPATAEPGDPNYDPQATMQVQRAAWNLKRYAQILEDSGPNPGYDEQGMAEFAVRLLNLYADYEKIEITTISGQNLEVYRIDEIRDGLATRIESSGFLETEDDGSIAISDFEVFPIPLQQTVGTTIAITSDNFGSLVDLTQGQYGTERADRETDGDLSEREITRRTETIARALERKIYDRLQEYQVIIANNIEKAFRIVDKSTFLAIIKEFYDISLENSREGTANELIDYMENVGALSLRAPQGLDFETYVNLVDKKSSNNKLPYTINVGDSFFLGSNETFNYCDEIPSNLMAYDEDIEGDEFPRRRAFAELYMNKLAEKAKKYISFSNVGTDIHENYGIISDGDNSFKSQILYNPVYNRTLEGTVEQLRNYVSQSRFLNNSNYIERMRDLLESKPVYKNNGTCVSNKFGLLGKGDLSFKKLILTDFKAELKKEYGRASLNILNIDPGAPSPTHFAISNIVVRAFVRLCILEFILKGALTLSVWDMEYLLDNQFFEDYIYKYVELEVSRNTAFTSKIIEFEDTLTRITNIGNKSEAMRSLIKSELATFVSLSKKIYDHDPTVSNTEWFIDSLPLVDVTSENPARQSGEVSLFDGMWKSSIGVEDFPVSQANNFVHLERYVRVKGPLVQASESSKNQLAAAQQKIGPIMNKIRETNFDRDGLPVITDYLDSDRKLAERFDDTIPFEELMSVPEFADMIKKLIRPDESVARFLADFFMQIGPQHTENSNAWGKPLALKSFPFRAIKRTRKVIRLGKYMGADYISPSSFNYKYHPCHFTEMWNFKIGEGENEYDPFEGSRFVVNQNGAKQFMDVEETGDSYDEAPRFYLIPEDYLEAEDHALYNADGEIDLEDFLKENDSNGGQYFRKNYLITRGKSKYFPEPGNANMGKTLGQRIQHGYTLPRRKMPGNKSTEARGQGNGNYYDILAPKAPWMRRTKEDTIFRHQPGDYLGYEEPDYFFANNYGEVTSDVFEAFLEQHPEIKVEHWEEKVIEMTGHVSPKFDKPGESYDPLLGQTLLPNPNLLQALFDYFPNKYADSYHDKVNTNGSAGIGPNHTFCFVDGFGVRRAGLSKSAGTPRLASTFGYHPPVEDVEYQTFAGSEVSPNTMTKGTYFNNAPFKIKKDANGIFQVNHQASDAYRLGTKLYRNEYKVPIRVLVTNVYTEGADSNTDRSTFAKVLIPEILNFKKSSTANKRLEYLRKAFSDNITSYMTSLEDAYDAILANAGQERPVDVTKQTIYQTVVDNCPSFPMWNRTPTAKNAAETNNNRPDFLSISKLYSAAAQLEAANKTGNFSDDQADLDKLFATDRGYMVKRSEYEEGTTNNFLNMTYQTDTTRGVTTYPTRLGIDHFTERCLQDYFNGANLGNLNAEEKRHILQCYRQKQFQAHGSWLGSIGDPNSSDNSRLLQAISLSNLLNHYMARRSDAFWGDTYNTDAYSDADLQNFSRTPTYQLMSVSENGSPIIQPYFVADGKTVHQLPIQESSFTVGAGFFYRDHRTWDWQVMAMILKDTNRKAFNSIDRDESGLGNLRIEQFIEAEEPEDIMDNPEGIVAVLLSQSDREKVFGEFCDRQARALVNLFGFNYTENKQYQEQFIGNNNVVATELGETNRLINGTHLHFNRRFRIQIQVNSMLQKVKANPGEYYQPDFEYDFREEVEALKSFYQQKQFMYYTKDLNPVSVGEEAFTYRGHTNLFTGLSGYGGYAILGDFYNMRNGIETTGLFSKVPGSTNLTAAERSQWCNDVFSNLQHYRDAAATVSQNYLAAMGPEGIDVYDDIMDILTAHAVTDESGELINVNLNVIRNSEIFAGMRLVHNTNAASMDSSEWNDQYINKMKEFAEINEFQKEERLGLMHAGTTGGRSIRTARGRRARVARTGQNYIFCNELASHETKIESFTCWSLGDDFEDVFQGMDPFLKAALTQKEEFKVYNKLCFPDKLYASIMTAHSTSMLAGYNTMPTVLVPTRNLMASIFSLMTSGTAYQGKIDDKFGKTFTAAELRNMIDNSIGDDGLDDCFSAPDMKKFLEAIKEMIEEMIKKFPSLVLRGIANQLDPAYKEIKSHWLNCQLDGFAWTGDMDKGQIITPFSANDKTPLGIRDPGKKGTYAPVNVAFPVDMIYSIYKLLPFSFDHNPMIKSVDKLISYIIGGNLPLLDPNYAFQIPCKNVDVKPSERWQDYQNKFAIGENGRYGQPVSLFTLLALSTPVLSEDRRKKMDCVYEEEGVQHPNSTNIDNCPEEVE